MTQWRSFQQQVRRQSIRGWLALALGLLTIAIGLAACGGSSSSVNGSSVASAQRSSSTSSSLTSQSVPPESPTPTEAHASAKLATAAERICRSLNRRLEKTVAHGLDASLLVPAALNRAALERVASARLVKLIPPPSLAPDWRQILAYRGELTQNLVTLAAAAKAGQREREGAAAKANEEVESKLQPLAERHEMHECGKGS